MATYQTVRVTVEIRWAKAGGVRERLDVVWSRTLPVEVYNRLVLALGAVLARVESGMFLEAESVNYEKAAPG
jgi:hypothetical protein